MNFDCISEATAALHAAWFVLILQLLPSVYRYRVASHNEYYSNRATFSRVYLKEPLILYIYFSPNRACCVYFMIIENNQIINHGNGDTEIPFNCFRNLAYNLWKWTCFYVERRENFSTIEFSFNTKFEHVLYFSFFHVKL